MAPIHRTPSEEEIAATLGNLQLSPSHPDKPLQKPKSKPVADSWDEDEDDEDNVSDADQANGTARNPHSATPTDALQPLSTSTSRDVPPNPPPPTPASPTHFEYPYDNSSNNNNVPYSIGSEGPRSRGLDKRPEKTTAVAGRLIAGALGVRAPRRTDEEREFDRVVRDKERKRRAEEREREKREAEAREARKKAVWED